MLKFLSYILFCMCSEKVFCKKNAKNIRKDEKFSRNERITAFPSHNQSVYAKLSLQRQSGANDGKRIQSPQVLILPRRTKIIRFESGSNRKLVAKALQSNSKATHSYRKSKRNIKNRKCSCSECLNSPKKSKTTTEKKEKNHRNDSKKRKPSSSEEKKASKCDLTDSVKGDNLLESFKFVKKHQIFFPRDYTKRNRPFQTKEEKVSKYVSEDKMEDLELLQSFFKDRKKNEQNSRSNCTKEFSQSYEKKAKRSSSFSKDSIKSEEIFESSKDEEKYYSHTFPPEYNKKIRSSFKKEEEVPEFVCNDSIEADEMIESLKVKKRDQKKSFRDYTQKCRNFYNVAKKTSDFSLSNLNRTSQNLKHCEVKKASQDPTPSTNEKHNISAELYNDH